MYVIWSVSVFCSVSIDNGCDLVNFALVNFDLVNFDLVNFDLVDLSCCSCSYYPFA